MGELAQNKLDLGGRQVDLGALQAAGPAHKLGVERKQLVAVPIVAVAPAVTRSDISVGCRVQ